VIGVAAIAYGIWLLHASMQQFGGIKKFGNALQTTLASAVLGITGAVLQFSYELNHVLTGARYHNVLPAYIAWYGIAVTLLFVFSSIASLNVSLLWIEIAQRSSRGSTAKASNVKRYRAVLYVYYPIAGGERFCL
jgi:hypothetical protein